MRRSLVRKGRAGRWEARAPGSLWAWEDGSPVRAGVGHLWPRGCGIATAGRVGLHGEPCRRLRGHPLTGLALGPTLLLRPGR